MNPPEALSLPAENVLATGYDRQPPYSLEAEVSVLGGMLIEGDAVAMAVEVVNDSMFYREANRRLFRSMVRLFERGDVVDVITLSEDLKKTDEFEDAGGATYLAELLSAVPTAANIEYHARIVRDKALLRRLIDAASNIIRDVYDQGEAQVEDVLDKAEQRVFQVAQSHSRDGFVWIKEILWPTFEHIERLQESETGITGLATGFPDLDRETTGFQKGDLIIVAGRPAMGKTSLVLNIAQNAAIELGTPVAIFSLEMSKEQLVQRLLCAEGRVDALRLRQGKLSSEEYQRLAAAAGHLNTAPLWIDDSPGNTVLEMRAKARRLQADLRRDGKELGMLMIDYMQLMAGNQRSESRNQEVSEISRGLKALARELEIPVVALSQLSRAPEQRTDRRPQLSDLRESGSIEQDADLVMFLYRPEYYVGPVDKDGNSVEGKAELIIGKQRNGPTGIVNLYFNKAYTRFDSVSRDSQREMDTSPGEFGGI
ncbi:MAG: replicative DNA helicase [Gemmatimonadetes bacterium]|nr:replicative DNA helicase [Gemmatimonadota bacterium]